MKRKLIAAIAVSISTHALAGLFEIGWTNWEEEALLSDGTTLVIERKVKRGGRHEIGQRPAFSDQILAFVVPGTKQRLVWTDSFQTDLGSSAYRPIAVDTVDGWSYVVTTPKGCLSYNKENRPNPPYVVFRSRDGDWQRIQVQELPSQISKPNLVISSADEVAKRAGFERLSTALIQRENAGYSQPEYKTILREPVKGAGSDCGEMIYDGHGGWTGIGWFKKQKSLDACVKYCERQRINAPHCPCETIFGVK